MEKMDMSYTSFLFVVARYLTGVRNEQKNDMYNFNVQLCVFRFLLNSFLYLVPAVATQY